MPNALAKTIAVVLIGLAPAAALGQTREETAQPAPAAKEEAAAPKPEMSEPPPKNDVPPAPIAPAVPAAPAVAPPQPPPPAAKEAAAPPPVPPAPPPVAARPSQIVVGSWGGAYGRAQEVAVFAPFASASGIRVKLAPHAGAEQELDRMKSDGTLRADVVDLGAGALHAACEAGLLERLDTGPEAGDDLVGARQPCGQPSLAWSSVMIVAKDRFKAAAPATLAEIFDIRRFPGPRALPRSPRYLLEVALMADGVEPRDVYGILGTDDGVKRALAKLRTLGASIVWWRNASEAVQLLRERKAVAGLAFSGRAFQEFAMNPSYTMVWDGQIYEFNYWAVPKGGPNAAAAREFIAFATAPERLATTARHFPYGPARRSALALVGRHAVLGIDLAPYLPTSPQNLARALQIDAAWWAANEARVKPLFEAWLAEPPPAPPQAAPAPHPRTRPPR